MRHDIEIERCQRAIVRTLMIGIGIVICILLYALYSVPASAHDWYPRACCSERDCSPVISQRFLPSGEIETKDEMGRTLIVPTSEKPQMSLDSRYHVCALHNYYYEHPNSLDSDLARGPEWTVLCYFEPGGA